MKKYPPIQPPLNDHERLVMWLLAFTAAGAPLTIEIIEAACHRAFHHADVNLPEKLQRAARLVVDASKHECDPLMDMIALGTIILKPSSDKPN
jgi:hypothetical protein